MSDLKPEDIAPLVVAALETGEWYDREDDNAEIPYSIAAHSHEDVVTLQIRSSRSKKAQTFKIFVFTEEDHV